MVLEQTAYHQRMYAVLDKTATRTRQTLAQACAVSTLRWRGLRIASRAATSALLILFSRCLH